MSRSLLALLLLATLTSSTSEVSFKPFPNQEVDGEYAADYCNGVVGGCSIGRRVFDSDPSPDTSQNSRVPRIYNEFAQLWVLYSITGCMTLPSRLLLLSLGPLKFSMSQLRAFITRDASSAVARKWRINIVPLFSRCMPRYFKD